jgi:hypothetical protein
MKGMKGLTNMFKKKQSPTENAPDVIESDDFVTTDSNSL